MDDLLIELFLCVSDLWSGLHREEVVDGNVETPTYYKQLEDIGSITLQDIEIVARNTKLCGGLNF